jgi:cytoskeletal protein CcmA (bactofilin family)
MFHRPRDDAQNPADQETPAGASERQQTQQPTQQENNPATASRTESYTTQSTPQSSGNIEQKERQSMPSFQNEDKNDQGNERQVDIPTNVRGAQTPPGASRIPGSYASNYPGYGGAAQSGSAQSSESLSRGRKLIVGNGISMSGEIDACDHLIVEGKVEAALKGASLLDIAETGVFYGTVEIEEATIAGRFEGDLTVNGRLTIKSTGSITGAISYRELAVDAGATVDGKISPIRDRTETRKTESGKARSSEAPARSRKEQQPAAQEDGLPFEKTVEAAE